MTTAAEATTDAPAMPAPTGGMNPYLEVDGALKAADFYAKAFGANTVYRVPPDEQGRTMHVHLYVNGSSLMLGDPYPDYGHPHQPAAGYTLQLHYAADAIDAAWQRAVDAGCTVEMPLQEMFWGDRWGSMRDPFGVLWAMNAPKA
ncbi:MAG: glyoxalase/bleomycin resistance/extradiol dioxygenase family protein [Rhizobiaceae bacterium]|nr:glyoxalase/bleomycin resistance/extradiol dioxygenase family protein [Rhizobiaceae bacterium]MCV0408584.1 glyoxalase/bleomycin resistance/extradiol dioxygenase family protein [Rhizobiaceae bacterium]